MQLAVSRRLRSSVVHDISFFVGVPLLLSGCMAVAGPYAAKIGYAGAFTYIAMLSFVPWWIAGLTTHIVRRRGAIGFHFGWLPRLGRSRRGLRSWHMLVGST